MTTVVVSERAPAEEDRLTSLPEPVDRLEARDPAPGSLATAAALVASGLTMIGFGVGWAYLFYPTGTMAVAGLVFAVGLAAATFGAAAREFALAAWRPAKPH
jgi:hypothetical protein